MNKINIAYIISYVSNDGPPNILFNIVKYLSKDKYNIFLFIIDKKNKYKDNKRFKELGINFIYLDLSKYKIFFYNIKKMEKIIKEKNIQIIHSHCLASTILISRLKNCIKISTIHCNFREDFKMINGKIKGKIMEKLYLNSLRKMNLNICCSESIKNQILNYSDLSMDYIKNGVDIEKFETKNSKIELRRKLNLKLNYKYFIAVGYFIQRKDPYFIAKNFTDLKLEKTKLILLGTSKKDKTIENKIRALKNKNIIMPGKVTNVNEYLNACDYFISSALYEGLPNAVLEACCAKLPILLSNIDPHKEVLNLSQNAGFLYELKNEQNFKEMLIKLISYDYQTLSEGSFKIVKEELNAKKMSQEYEKKYWSLLKGKNEHL